MIADILSRASARAATALSSLAFIAVCAAPGAASAHPNPFNPFDDHLCDDDEDKHVRYRVTDIDTTSIAGLKKRTLTVQVGQNAANRFFVHRVSLPIPNHHLRGVILLLPPVSSGFQNYEVGEDGTYESSFVGYFASRGYDVWGYSQRVQNVTAGSCESGAVDCSVMANWGMDAMVDDIAFIRRRIDRVRPFARVAIGGLSLGAMATVATLDRHPHDYDGAFLLEGTLFDTDPASRSINAGFCDDFEGLLNQGVYYDGQQLSGVKGLASLATTDPNGQASAPGLPPGLTNHQAFVALFSTPAVTPTTPRPDYFFLAGDVGADSFTYANDALFRANVGAFVDYIPTRVVRDVNCSLAGDRTFTQRLHRYRGALFVNAGGHGFGQAMLDTIDLMPHADATVSLVPTFGHVDHFFAENHVELTEEPLLDWMEDEVFGYP